MTKDRKELLFTSKSEPGRYDTRKIKVYKVISGNPANTKELINNNLQNTDEEKEVGETRLSFKLPTDDKRVSHLLIYLYPSSDVDTITYKGGGKYGLPFPKDVFL